MSILNKLPLTTFKLPSGETIESRNILKTIVFSKQTKENPNILKKIFSVNTAKIENVSYDFYNDNSALYWLTMHLNDIDSFENAPLPQGKFESNLAKRFPGTSYQIYQGKNPKFILPGDLIILPTGRATATFTFGNIEWDDAAGETITLIDGNGISKTYTIVADGADAASQEFNDGASASAAATNFKTLVESTDGHNGTIFVVDNASPGRVDITQEVAGTVGNSTIAHTSNWDSICDKKPPDSFSGGTTEKWKNAGIVKEYDQVFRRIILKREVINSDNTEVLPTNPTIEIYRKTGVSWNSIGEVDANGDPTGTSFKLGIKEPEVDKVVGFYNPNLNGELRSTFSSVNSASTFNFTDTPDANTLIRIYSDTANSFNASLFTTAGFYKHTLRNEEIRKNTSTNTLSFFSAARAYEVTTFVNTLLGSYFKRGQSINVDG